MADLRIVFMGTPDFAVPTLEALQAAPDMDVVAVYTQPPRQAGRGKRLRHTPVHDAALASSIAVFTPVVVAYGLILPGPVLRAPRLGCFNLHGSLLPRWRGAAPIQRAVMAGDAMTGVCVMAMDEGLDTGDEISRAEVPIAEDTTAGDLHDQLAVLGAPLMVAALRGIAAGDLSPLPQPETGITYAKKIDKAEARIDWRLRGEALDCLIRGLSPYPGAWCEWQGDRVKVLLAQPVAASHDAAPGTVLDDKLLVACGSGAMRLLRLQRSGKGVMSAADFLRGNPLQAGDMLL